jgi:hypothetical protein
MKKMTLEILDRRRNYSIQRAGFMKIEQILLDNIGAKNCDCVWLRFGSDQPLLPYRIEFLRTLQSHGFKEITALGWR